MLFFEVWQAASDDIIADLRAQLEGTEAANVDYALEIEELKVCRATHVALCVFFPAVP